MASPNITYTGNREAPFLEDYRRRLLESTFKRGDQPMPSERRGIADFDTAERAAFNFGAGQMGIDPATGMSTGDPAYKQYLDTGMNTIGQGIAPLQAAQQQYDPSTSNVSGFMNQYQQNVTNKALEQMNEQFQKQMNKMSGDAVQGNVFGGSRFGVAQAEAQKGLADMASQRIFQDMSQNFQQAQGNAINTFNQNQANQLAAANQFGQLGTQQANMGAQMQQLGQQGLGSLLNIGGIRRQRDQQLNDETYRFNQERAREPYQRLGFMSDILSRTPSMSQTMLQTPQPYTNPLLGAIGAGITGLQAYGGMTGN